MKKNKLITPAGILGIIGSSLSLLCGLSLLIIAEALKTNDDGEIAEAIQMLIPEFENLNVAAIEVIAQ